MTVDAGGADVPDGWEDWPFEAKAYVLAEANTAIDLRRDIESVVGMEPADRESDSANQFTKAQLAMILMALGGPNGGETA